VIDNLELLNNSRTARALLEALRDTMLDLPGLRWVLCGAKGIVRTAASSPRLQGRLAEPIELTPLSDERAEGVVRRRIEAYAMSSTPTTPVGPASFLYAYRIFNRNLRSALKACEDYTFWMHDNVLSFEGVEDDQLFEVWLSEQADEYVKQTRLPPHLWELFSAMGRLGGECHSTEYQGVGVQSQGEMDSSVRSLEDSNLVLISDEEVGGSNMIEFTPRGWLVQYARSAHRNAN
jgi:hypothetical protein